MTRFDWGQVCHALARLTGDREPKVRMAAVDALCAFGNREAELIVLTRTMAGDSSEEVMGVCFRALMAFDRETYLDLVAEHLMRGDDAVRVEAAFALAESRPPEVFEILHGAWEEESGTDMRRSLLLAIGMLRTPEAAALLAGHLNDSRFGEIARETLESYPAELREGTRSG
jgi:HEAT repeat protein